MPNALDVHPAMHEAAKDPSRRLWIGEGTKKGDAMATRGEVCVSLTGVDCWKSKGAALVAWNDIPRKDRELVIVYDADGQEKPGVTRAMREQGQWHHPLDRAPPGLTGAIARLAAELRAARGLRLPDAVTVAAGLRLQADVVLTADAGWKGIETVKVVDGQR